MGFILDAIGAAATAGGDMLAEQRKSDAQLNQQRALAADSEQRNMRLAEFNKKLDIQKQQEIEKLKLETMPRELAVKSDAEDASRKKRAGELDAATKGIVNRAQADKLNKFYDDGKTRSFEEFAPEELSVPEAQLTAAERSYALRRAGLETGQLSANDALANDAKDAAMEGRWQIAQLQADVQNAKSDAQREVALAKLEAGMARIGAAGSAASREERMGYTALLQETGRRIDNETAKLKDIPRGKAGDADREIINAKIKKLEAERELYQSGLVGVTEKPPKSGSPKADPAKGGQKESPKIDAAAALGQARQAIARNPKNRDEVIRRLKANNIPIPKDL